MFFYNMLTTNPLAWCFASRFIYLIVLFFVEGNIEYTIETQQAGGRNYQRRKINLGFFSLYLIYFMSWQLAHKF